MNTKASLANKEPGFKITFYALDAIHANKIMKATKKVMKQSRGKIVRQVAKKQADGAMPEAKIMTLEDKMKPDPESPVYPWPVGGDNSGD